MHEQVREEIDSHLGVDARAYNIILAAGEACS